MIKIATQLTRYAPESQTSGSRGQASWSIYNNQIQKLNLKHGYEKPLPSRLRIR